MMEMKRCLGCMNEYEKPLMVCPYCGYVEGTPAEEPIHMKPGTILHNQYVIGKVLGYGSFGVTYIGWDENTERKVAIKEYFPSEFSTRMPGQTVLTVSGGNKGQQFQAGMRKFVDEAIRLKRFSSEPGVVTIIDSFEENATAYIIMEYLEGETLEQYLEREGTVPEEEAIQMLLPVMESLHVLHQEGLLHRDISPDNIFLPKGDDAKLIDFGASRFATTSHSRSMTVIIKPGYSPEEQYRSRGDQGPHTDVYALGATLYRMITGKTPPDAMERRARFENSGKDLLIPPHKIAKEISRDRENAILNAMNVRIENRTPDIPEFMTELQGTNVKKVDGKIDPIDLYTWPTWLKAMLPSLLGVLVVLSVLLVTGIIDLPGNVLTKLPDGIVRVENIEWKKLDEANSILDDQHLIPDAEIQYASENIDEKYIDVVINQNPKNGSFLEIWDTVKFQYIVAKSIPAANGTAVVPYFRGMDRQDVEGALTDAGFLVAEDIEKDWSDCPKGKVCALRVNGEIVEEPEGEYPEGSLVTLILSKGSEPKKLQDTDILNRPYKDVVKLLQEEYKLKVTLRPTYNNNYDEGKVVDYEPKKEKYQANDEITIYYSVKDSTKTAVIPERIIGMDYKNAEKLLKEKGFKSVNSYEGESGAPSGQVYKVNQERGISLPVDTQIVIWYSSGISGTTEPPTTTPTEPTEPPVIEPPTEESTAPSSTKPSQVSTSTTKPTSTTTTQVVDTRVVVPNLVSNNINDAQNKIESLGLKANIKEDYSDLYSENKVMKQAPTGGTKVEKGSTVTITVSLGPHYTMIYFDAQGGTVSQTSSRVRTNTLLVSLPTPQRNGYKFLGWYTEPNGSGKKFESMSSFPDKEEFTLYAAWKSNEVSKWVEKSQVPQGAEIYDSKYQYRDKAFSESSSSSKEGWTCYEKKITGWGSWSGWSSTAVTATESRQVEKQNVPAQTKTVYCYYRWVAPDGKSAATYNMGSGYTYQSIELDYELDYTGTTSNGQVARYGEYVGNYGTYLKRIWYKSSPFTKTVTTKQAYTNYRYRDAVYTYYFYRWPDEWIDSTTKPSETSDRQVREMCRYIIQ